jgi:hypothetical protein
MRVSNGGSGSRRVPEGHQRCAVSSSLYRRPPLICSISSTVARTGFRVSIS